TVREPPGCSWSAHLGARRHSESVDGQASTCHSRPSSRGNARLPDVYACKFEILTPEQGAVSQTVIDSLRSWISHRIPEGPVFELDHPWNKRTEDGSVLRWEPFQHLGRTLLDFTWKHPHVGAPEIWWSTNVTC